ncbi:PRE_C2HC domain-containing protein [Trichonephila clavipes]|nr:PRE_C2HC domain-containing protein [Trichonephila clavipes]
MHLPTSKLGSVIKAGSCFNSTIVPAASSALQSPSSYSSSCKKKKKKKTPAASPFRLRFGAPRTRFGAVKPPSLRSSIPARVTCRGKRSLTHYLESDKDFEYFCIKPKLEKPIKVVIKGLPIFTKTLEIHSDLEEEGFTVEKVSQLISKKHKGPLPFFQITLPRNANNLKIFDLKTLGYLQVRVEGFLVRGITQCFNCNNFFHTASDCHLKPRCLKCGKDHPTKQCQIKERQENPFCINCQEYGHSACYTKCPHFPKPRKGSPLPKTPTFNNNKCKEGVSFANIVSGINSPPLSTPNENDNIQANANKNSKENHGINKEETSDLAQVIELISLISNILKKSPEIIQILKNLKSTKDETAQTYLLVEALLNKN